MTKRAPPRDLSKRAKIATARDFTVQLARLVGFYLLPILMVCIAQPRQTYLLQKK